MAVQDWNTLREVATLGYSDGVLCLASIAVIERSNRPEVLGPLNESDAGRAANILVSGALFRLHMFIVRAFAPSRHRDDRHLRTAIDFLRVHGRINEDRWPERQANLVEAVRLFDEASTDIRLEGLKHMRDKLMAHMAQYDETIRKPRYDDLFGFARLTCEIWQHLAFGTGSVMIEIDNQVDAYRESGNAFWSRWEE